jgi:hypothetical protein
MNCPRPRVNRCGELECHACGLTWAVDDPAPDCEQQSRQSTKRSRLAATAIRELVKIRDILRKEP